MVYLPRTQVTLVLIGSSALFWGKRPSKIEVSWVLGTYVWLKSMVNVGKYTIPGCYGL